MNYPPEQAAIFLQEAQRVLLEETEPDFKLKKLWWTLVFLRSKCLTRDLKRLLGGAVYSGPFKGMKLTDEAMADNSSPHMLGSYESELHPAIERVIAQGYERILNIGCSFGYYSIGLALRMPHVKVDAFDISDAARKKCRDMAALNGVSDRVTVSGEFHGEDFVKYTKQKTLAFVDIEAHELELLDPVKFPALREIDVIVELHDLAIPTISKTVTERFLPSHDCEIVRNKHQFFPFEEIFGTEKYIDPFDSFIATWEIRDGHTPWGVYRVK